MIKDVDGRDVLLWLDVETTGLNVDRDHLLEVAVLPTLLDETLTPIDDLWTRVVALPDGLRFKDVAVEMHARSGLWRDCLQSGLTVERLWRQLGSQAVRWNLGSAGSVTLAGRSVHFDRGWQHAVQ